MSSIIQQKNTKQKRLTLKEKLDVLKKSAEGVQGKRLALEYGISTAAISKILKNRQAILEATTNTLETIQKKTLHKPEYEELEKQFFEWFLNQRARNCAITGPIFKARAKIDFERIYPDKGPNAFNASEGWFNRFKRRHGIRYLKVCGEVLSSDMTQITPFIHHLRAKIFEMELTDAQLYNADESGLFYRLLPDKTFVASNEKNAPGRKTAKERITFLLCANAEGTHKVKPLVIGKYAKPRCFKGFENPLDYANSKSSWMTSLIFYDWFHNCFVKQVIFCFFSKNSKFNL